MTVDVVDLNDEVQYLTVLTKSTDPVLREQAEEALSRLAIAAPQVLLKVGPKGYVHGWIYVGPQAAGSRVLHTAHGHGTVTRHEGEGGKVHVKFDSGETRSFESGKHKPGAAHFVERKPPVNHKPVAEHHQDVRPLGDTAARARERARTAAILEAMRQAPDARPAEATKPAPAKPARVRKPKPRAVPEPKPPTAAPTDPVQRHLDNAHAAIAEGRHADAVNHLTTAARHAPNKATRKQIEQQRNALAARLMGKPVKRPKAKSPKGR